MPAHTMERLWMNWAMHWGQGVLLGAVRGLMAERGLRGPVRSFVFMNLRLGNDQTLENATGAPPWTWPTNEQVVDLLHEAIYAFTTGAVSDRLVPGPRKHAENRTRRPRFGGLDDGYGQGPRGERRPPR